MEVNFGIEEVNVDACTDQVQTSCGFEGEARARRRQDEPRKVGGPRAAPNRTAAPAVTRRSPPAPGRERAGAAPPLSENELNQRYRTVNLLNPEAGFGRGDPPLPSDVSLWVRDALTHYWGGPRLSESPLLS